MKELRIKILIILMTFAVLGLIAVQVYWSIKTIATEEIRFDAKVNEAMINIVSKIDKEKTVEILIKKVSGDKDKVVWVENNTNIIDSNEVVFFSSDYAYENSDTNGNHVKVTVETSPNLNKKNNTSKSNNKVIKRVFKYDSEGTSTVTVEQTKVDTIVLNKKKLLTEVIEEMTSFDEEHYLHEQLSESYLDSMIIKEFNNSGIETVFSFGVQDRNTKQFVVVKAETDKRELEKSKYNISMSPHDIFAQPLKLLIYIPNKFNYMLKSIWIMLVLTLVFVGIIVVVYIKTLRLFLDQKKITEVKNDLINNITHEFKTPISSISLAAEALQEPQLLKQHGSIKKYSEVISEENIRLTKLVENLLNTAAFERSEIELKKEKVNVREAVTTIIDKTKERIGEINISLFDETNKDAIIKADLFHFTNIISNLVNNSAKYSEEVADISIKIVNSANGVEVSVTDKGIGISRSNQQKIFETFYRVPTGNIHDAKGNGIGLSYVKKIVEAHSGWVKINSKLGEGSTFTIFLPNE